MEIHSSHPWPSGALSNFAARTFVFDDVHVGSMEGLLQAFKFENPAEQIEVCALAGIKAKNRGTVRREQWQSTQTLWWKGQAYDRHGAEYAALLDRAYQAMCDQCEDFRKALLATHSAPLSHTIGNSDPYQTILTPTEMCGRLTRLRTKLQQALDHEPVVVDDATRNSMDSLKARLAGLKLGPRR
jgi:hypothetical protein